MKQQIVNLLKSSNLTDEAHEKLQRLALQHPYMRRVTQLSFQPSSILKSYKTAQDSQRVHVFLSSWDLAFQLLDRLAVQGDQELLGRPARSSSIDTRDGEA